MVVVVAVADEEIDEDDAFEDADSQYHDAVWDNAIGRPTAAVIDTTDGCRDCRRRGLRGDDAR